MYKIRGKKSNQLSLVCYRTEVKRYSNNNNNIKYIDSTIKCIGFESFHYTINLDISSFMVFNDFNSIFLTIYC